MLKDAALRSYCDETDKPGQDRSKYFLLAVRLPGCVPSFLSTILESEEAGAATSDIRFFLHWLGILR